MSFINDYNECCAPIVIIYGLINLNINTELMIADIKYIHIIYKYSLQTTLAFLDVMCNCNMI